MTIRDLVLPVGSFSVTTRRGSKREVIPAGGSKDFEVVFYTRNIAPQAYQSMLRVYYNNERNPLMVRIVARVVPPRSVVFTLPEGNTFAAKVQTPIRQNIRISNLTNAPLAIKNITCSMPQFKIISSIPSSLRSGETTTVTVEFRPDAHTVYNAKITVVTEIDTTEISIKGFGVVGKSRR